MEADIDGFYKLVKPASILFSKELVGNGCFLGLVLSLIDPVEASLFLEKLIDHIAS